MSKRTIGIIIAVLILLGVFSISISKGGFFFTTKYYRTPMEAYNADNTYNAIYGDTAVEKELALVSLDNETCLFVGEMNESCFVVCEMEIKDSKYASKGSLIVYNLKDCSNSNGTNATPTSNGYVNWAIMYNEEEINNTTNIQFIETLTHTNGMPFYIVVYGNSTGDGFA